MSSGRRSRNKGARGEIEVARILTAAGWQASRMGRNGVTSEDVLHNLPGYHLEVKRCETLQLPKWLRQAEGDAAEGAKPLVVFRQSKQPWRVVIKLDDFLEIVQPNC